jgi:hypothetical protein
MTLGASRLVWIAVVAAVFGCGDSTQDRMQQRQRALDEARAKQAEQKPTARNEPGTAQRAAHPYWDNSSLVVMRNEKACPEGLWALFPGQAPGGDDPARRANEAKRGELASALRSKTFVARLRGPEEVKLREYDAPKGHFPLDLRGVIDCQDSIGRIAVAFTEPKAITPKGSVMSGVSGDAVIESIWDAPPRPYEVPMRGVSEAKAFRDRHQFGLEAYVVFKLGKSDVHHKKLKIAKETSGDVTIGGGIQDFGAGRMVRGEVDQVRVLANPGPVVVVDTREPAVALAR